MSWLTCDWMGFFVTEAISAILINWLLTILPANFRFLLLFYRLPALPFWLGGDVCRARKCHIQTLICSTWIEANSNETFLLNAISFVSWVPHCAHPFQNTRTHRRHTHNRESIVRPFDVFCVLIKILIGSKHDNNRIETCWLVVSRRS